MKYSQTSTEALSVVRITAPSDILVLKLSADIHEKNNATAAATQLVYAEALLSGAGTYSREAFLDAANKLGASISVTTDYGRVEITLKALASNSEKSLKLLRILLEKPLFKKSEIDRIKEVSHNELTEYQENARGRSLDELENQLYESADRRANPSISSLKSAVQQLSATDLKKFHTTVRSTQWKVTIGGNKNSVAHAENAVTGLQKKIITRIAKHAPKTNVEKRVKLVSIPSKTNIEFAIGAPLPITVSHPDYPAFFFGLSVLGKWGGFTGRLMSTVREKEGLTYGIYAKTETMHNEELGFWRVMTFFAPEKAGTGIRSTIREIKKITKEGITSEELKRFKVILKTQQDLIGDSLAQTIAHHHALHVMDLSPEAYADMYNKIGRLTRAKVNDVLAKYISLKEIQIVGAGPTAGLQKPLEKLI